MAGKPHFGDPDYNLLWDNVDWETTPRMVVLGLTKLVPEVGSVISAVLDKIWSDPASTEALIKKSEERMKAWVSLQIEQRIAKYDMKVLTDSLKGLRKNLDYYRNAAENGTLEDRKTWWNNCIQDFNALEPTFLNPEDYHGSLPLIQALGTLHISLLHEPVVNYDQVFGPGGSAGDRQFRQKELTDTIKEYQDFISNKACPAIIKARKEQIRIEPNDRPPRQPSAYLVDDGTTVRAPLNAGPQIAEQYKAFFVNDLETRLQKEVLDVALAWSELDPSHGGRPSINPDRLVWIGPVGLATWDYQNNAHGFPLVNGLKKVLSPVRNGLLKHGVIVDYLLLWDDGKMRDSQTGDLRGLEVGNPAGGTKSLIHVPDGQDIKQVDTYWNYTCMGIQFHYTDGTASPVLGNGDNRPKHVHIASYPNHVLRSIAVYGHQGGVSEFYFGFSPDPRKRA
jgi:hypothetical protein